MAPKEKTTYFLYQEGRASDVLCLGNLILGDYSNPTVSDHYTHRQLSDEELKQHAPPTTLKDRIIHSKKSPNYGFKLSASQIVDSDVSWKSTDEIMLTAKAGTRIELKDAVEFLNTEVLSRGGEAEKILKKWLSSANSEYMLKMKWVRRPTIWMCTGLYLLQDTRLFTTSSQNIHTSVGVSALTMSALTGVPLGGSINISPETSLKMSSISEEKLVWAAQYRRLDVKYISLQEDEEPTLPSVLSLYKDVTSQGTLRSGSLSNENEFDAVQVEVDAETEDSDESKEGDEVGEREYYARLHEAVLKFEKWGL